MSNVFPTLDPRVERRSPAAARAEGCKRGWSWVLECVLSPQRSDMVSLEACCSSRVSRPQPSVSFLHSRPSPCCEFLKKVNSSVQKESVRERVN